MKNDIEDYCKEVGGFKVLTAEQNAVLAKRGTKQAREELVNANLRLVIMWARRFANVTGLELEDLIQEGNIGLMIAAKRFNPKKAQFSTLASWWIKAKIRRYVAEKTELVKGPGWLLRRLVRRWKQTAEALKQETNREPTNAEIQEKLKLKKHHLAQVKIALSLKNFVRLDDYDNEENAGGRPNELPDTRMENMPGHLYTFGGRKGKDGTPGEVIEATMGEIRQTLNSVSMILRNDDNGKEMQVWERRYLKHQTLEQIGQALGMTRERVRQIETEVLRKMREFLKRKAGRIDEVGTERALVTR